MARSDPPGKGPGVTVAIAVPKPGGRMGPPGGAGGAAGDGKVSPEDAHVIRADSHCIDCQNYDAQQGICSKVGGPFDPQDGCIDYFDALNDSDQEPDADDTGGPSDNDADDQGAA